MNVGLGIECDASVEHLMPVVRGLNNALKEYFANREYGTDLIHIAIGMILVTCSPIAQRFHPVRPFEYSRLDRVKHPGTGQIIEIHNSASWDIKPDLKAVSGMDLEAALGYLCNVLIASTGCLEEHHNLFPNFDVGRFRRDFAACLNQGIINGDAH